MRGVVLFVMILAVAFALFWLYYSHTLVMNAPESSTQQFISLHREPGLVQSSQGKWLDMVEEGFSFQYPPAWTVTTTTYGATQIKSYEHEGEPTVGEVKITILPPRPFFDCAAANPCFKSLADLANYLGYDSMATTSVGANPALVGPNKSGAVNFFIRAGTELINIVYAPASTTQVATATKLLNTFHVPD